MAEEEKEKSIMKRVWNNKRRSSLYNLKDSVGLKYRRASGLQVTRRQLLAQTPIRCGDEVENNGVEQAQHPAAGKSTSVRQSRGKTPGRTATVESSISPDSEKNITEEVPHDQSCVTPAADSSDYEEEMKKQAMATSECDHFFKELKEEFAQNMETDNQNEIRTQLAGLHDEAKASGLFRRAMEEPEIVPYPVEESARLLQQEIQKYDEEINGWKSLLERKQKELQTGESSLLPEIDDAFLEKYLNDQHRNLLRGTVDTKSFNEFLGKLEQQLDKIEKSLDKEIQAVIMEKENLEGKLSAEQRRCMAFLLPTETPRGLLQDMKRCIPTNSDQT